jgi:hypothetical protein
VENRAQDTMGNELESTRFPTEERNTARIAMESKYSRGRESTLMEKLGRIDAVRSNMRERENPLAVLGKRALSLDSDSFQKADPWAGNHGESYSPDRTSLFPVGCDCVALSVDRART